MMEEFRRWRPGPSKRKTLNPRFRISSRVFHSRRTPPPCRGTARKEASWTAVGAAIVEVTDAVLFVRFGSPVVAETVAVLVESVAELNVLAFTLIVMSTSPPTLTVPSEQPTVVVATV